MQLDDLITVSVSVRDAGITRQGFSTMLLFAYHTHYQDVVRTYAVSNIGPSLVADGFSVTEPAYIAATLLAKQRPHLTKIKIGKRQTAETQLLWITPTVGAAAYTHYFTIINSAGVSFPISFANDGTPTLAEACTGIAAAVNAASAGITADGTSGTKVILTANAANTLFTVTGMDSSLTLTDVTAVANIGTELDTVKTADNDWYGLAMATPAPAALKAAADWIETQKKIAVLATHDQDILGTSTTDICSYIKTNSYKRSKGFYAGKALEFAASSLLGLYLTFQPGQSEFFYRQLTGVTADAMTANQTGHAYAKNALTYETAAGVSFVTDFNGGGGQYLDTQQIADWVAQRLQESFVSAQLAAVSKIPYTDAGIGAVMYGICKAVVSEGIQNGAIDPDETTQEIIVPLVKDQTPANRAARIFPGTVLNFRATGAANTANVSVGISA